MPDAKVSTPLHWDEVADVEAEDLRIDTVPDRVARARRPVRDDRRRRRTRLDPLLELVRKDIEERGLEDAPWPPNYAKQPGEPPRVQPSKAKKKTED